MTKPKDKTDELPVIYDDPVMGRREFRTKWKFTQAAEHEKWCCNCRHCTIRTTGGSTTMTARRASW